MICNNVGRAEQWAHILTFAALPPSDPRSGPSRLDDDDQDDYDYTDYTFLLFDFDGDDAVVRFPNRIPGLLAGREPF